MEETEFVKKYEGRDDISTMEEFKTLFEEAMKDADDYGSIVRCCSLMMEAAFNLVNRHENGGITGLQAWFIMWDMVHKFGGFNKDVPLRIQNFEELMYPQYEDKFSSIPSHIWEGVQRAAKEKVMGLEKEGCASPDVIAHMKTVAEGRVPFGLKISEE